jgi:hypothetical protein
LTDEEWVELLFFNFVPTVESCGRHGRCLSKNECWYVTPVGIISRFVLRAPLCRVKRTGAVQQVLRSFRSL